MIHADLRRGAPGGGVRSARDILSPVDPGGALYSHRMTSRILTAFLAVAATTPTLAADRADGAAAYAQRCSACHGKAAEGTEMGPPIAGKPAADVWYAVTVGGGRDHKPGTKWKMKPVNIEDVDTVALYVAGLKK